MKRNAVLDLVAQRTTGSLSQGAIVIDLQHIQPYFLNIYTTGVVLSRSAILMALPFLPVLSPSKLTHPPTLSLRLDASENLTVRFTNRQNIVASFHAADCSREWHCGDSPRRLEGPYTSKVVGSQPGGKLELDVAAIRQRQQVGSALRRRRFRLEKRKRGG